MERKKLYIGIDNGVTGTIGIVGPKAIYRELLLKPVKTQQDYTKKKKNVTRVDHQKYVDGLNNVRDLFQPDQILVVMERPMVNPARFFATASALRCLESEIIIMERLGFPYIFIDSKAWQAEFFPKARKNQKNQLKKLSLQIGGQLFPDFKDCLVDDMDGLLIAEYARRKGL